MDLDMGGFVAVIVVGAIYLVLLGIANLKKPKED